MKSKKTRFILKRYFIIIFILLPILLCGLWIFTVFVQHKYLLTNNETPKKFYREQPFYVRGIYLSSWTAATPKLLDKTLELARNNQINSLVIDLKDSSGNVAYDSRVPLVNHLNTKQVRISVLRELTDKLHGQGFYLIARLSMFQDTVLAESKPEWALKNVNTGKIWRDRRNLAWVDPASPDVWQYNLDIAREAYDNGFDEINFDYIRFPSDGDISLIKYPVWDKQNTKAEVIKQFFAKQYDELKKYGPRSIDLFGLTLWHLEDGSDMNIGQSLANAMPYFDYICPMVYPSHYPSGFENFSNPADHPYDVVYRSLNKSRITFETMRADPKANHPYVRPWLQAFDLGAIYNLAMIKEQIRATDEGGGLGWILWNARNDYSSFNGYSLK
ncbi:MAG: putative glycoside hydrolase [Patescibacteria group bacterium]|nr:putative glycoside hydrolase [Patescibacteria group bacterium]